MSSSGPVLRRTPQSVTHAVRECLLCGSEQLEYEFVVDKVPVCRCQDCGLLFLNPAPASNISSDTPSVDPLNSEVLSSLYRANAAERLSELIAYTGTSRGRLLLIGTDEHARKEAQAAGFEVVVSTVSHLDEDKLTPAQPYDACLLFCALERTRNPLAALKRIRQLLRPGATLMVISPTIDTAAARLFKHEWWEFNRSNLFYFSVDTLQNLLVRAGFVDPLINPDRTLVSLNYVRQRLASAHRQPRRLRLLRTASALTPFFRNRRFRNLHSRTRFLVRAAEPPQSQRVSVIVPVYNEKATCAELLNQLLAKNIPGVDIEVIIVESNSPDGSREIVLQYQDHPRVKLILEPKPMGKGHAVRTGLNAATGDIILFQDADLEYDLNDYEGLLEPLLHFRHNFILGSRHTSTNSSWKIRSFEGAPGLSGIFNFGHLLFLTMFNTLYGQKLTDPFTMFKVFRRECLYGLRFECNRFDFDYEIVIKLLRKGYVPKELPVNYTSRSLAEGKKVTMFRDPITWIRAMLKFKRSPLY